MARKSEVAVPQWSKRKKGELCLFHTLVQQEAGFDSTHTRLLQVWEGFCGSTHTELHPRGRYTLWQELKGEADVSLIIAGGLLMSLQTCQTNLLLHSDGGVRQLLVQTSRISEGKNPSVGKSNHLDHEIIERAWNPHSTPILNTCEKISDHTSQRMIGLAQTDSGFINNNAFRLVSCIPLR